MFAGRLAGDSGVQQVAQAVRDAPPPTDPPHAGDMMLEALAVLFTDGYERAVPIRRRALEAFRADRHRRRGAALALGRGGGRGRHVGRRELARCSPRVTSRSRVTRPGRSASSRWDSNSRIVVHLFAGELDAAASLVEEARTVANVIDSDLAPYGALGLVAWQGREGETDALAEASMSDVAARGEGIAITVTQSAKAVLLNGLGRARGRAPRRRAGGRASARAVRAELGAGGARGGVSPHRQDGGGHRGVGAPHGDDPCRRDGLGARSRCRARALLSEGDAADELHREAIARLGRTRVRAELARAHLLFGEWLRGRGARDRGPRAPALGLRPVLGHGGRGVRGSCSSCAADRRRDRPAARDDARGPHRAGGADRARLAAAGQANPEIGAQLFISPRTVEYHLREVFAKLDIGSRRDLRAALPDATAAAWPRGAQDSPGARPGVPQLGLTPRGDRGP